MSDLLSRYVPRWLYLHEFALSLENDDEDELKEAIALLVRDRLIVDGSLNEREFRFLEGKPDLRTTAWINKLSANDFNFATSELIAGVDTTRAGSRVSDAVGILIEIAASALVYFGEAPEAARRSPQDGPELRRAKAVLKKLYGDRIPSAEHLTDGDLHKAVNQAREKDMREMSKTTILRAASRRNDQRSK